MIAVGIDSAGTFAVGTAFAVVVVAVRTVLAAAVVVVQAVDSRLTCVSFDKTLRTLLVDWEELK